MFDPMMYLKQKAELNSKHLSPLRYIPYSLRLGPQYKKHIKLISWYEKATNPEREKFHYEKLKLILEHAYANIPLYKNHYDTMNYHPEKFKTLSHFKEIPIISKAILREFSLENRTFKIPRTLKITTAGTSGNPLTLLIDKNCFAREWAYMHHIWKRLNYSYLDTKLYFRGKDIGEKSLKYNVVHNEYIVNAYKDFSSITTDINSLSSRKKIKYIHGYPSSIYEFCQFLKKGNIDANDLFHGNLQGVFLGSEYPSPVYRELIEQVLNVQTISWYGHSEFSVLAYEKKPFIYTPFPTYGYSEAQPEEDSEEYKLICTGYYNYACPFIRYDTGDLISAPEINNGRLNSFKISTGRSGEFITDSLGKKISLTSLIIGRRHKVFEKADFVQIKQEKEGEATFIVSSQSKVSLDDFDLKNVAIDFDLKIQKKPFKTTAGKVPLLVK